MECVASDDPVSSTEQAWRGAGPRWVRLDGEPSRRHGGGAPVVCAPRSIGPAGDMSSPGRRPPCRGRRCPPRRFAWPVLRGGWAARTGSRIPASWLSASFTFPSLHVWGVLRPKEARPRFVPKRTAGPRGCGCGEPSTLRSRRSRRRPGPGRRRWSPAARGRPPSPAYPRPSPSPWKSCP